MSDAPAASLLDQPRTGSNLPEFTVSEISRQLKQTVEDRFAHVRVRAEIGECKYHGNGHVYLSLRDDSACLAGVIWKGSASKLGLRPEVGMDVVCTGRLTTYAGQSKYQMVIEQMALAGEGALLKLIEDRKRKLAAEGLFDAARKPALPYMPRRIGVVTSPTGAVIRDILHRISDRFPCHVMVWPVAVQGPDSAAQVAAAINGFNALPSDSPLRPDVLIVARGGGSLEDLMGFNEEIVVRAAAASRIPLISAVGHETDTTLIDFAAARRAPTPTAAAEMAVPVRADLLGQCAALGARLEQAGLRALSQRRERVGLLARTMGDPRRLLEPLWQRTDDRAARLDNGMRQLLTLRLSRLHAVSSRLPHPRDVVRLAGQRLNNEARALDAALRQRLQQFEERRRRLPETAQRLERSFQLVVESHAYHLRQLGKLLTGLSPQGVLERGYALVRDKDGHVIASAAAAAQQQSVTLTFHDGALPAQLGKNPAQGRLF